MEKFEDADDVRVRGVFEDLQLTLHQIQQQGVEVYVVFADDFHGALQAGLAVLDDTDLAEVAIANYAPNLIPVFDVLDVFKAFELLETKDMLGFDVGSKQALGVFRGAEVRLVAFLQLKPPAHLLVHNVPCSVYRGRHVGRLVPQ